MIRSHVIRFARMVFETYCCTNDELIAIVKAKGRVSARFRAAALRNLVGNASLSVTLGRPYAERRRLVRKHYGV
jgi:hypothetical protein